MTDNLGTVIQYLYPDAKFVKDYFIVRDDEGTRIKYWNEEVLGLLPDIKYLESVEQEAVAKMAQVVDNKQSAIAIIKTLKNKDRGEWLDDDYKDAIFSLVQLFI